MRLPALPILAVTILLLFQASPAFAASTDDPARVAAIEQGKAEAATLLKTGEAVKAYELYMRLARTAADDDEVHLGLARAATKASRWNQAVMAYETLLEKYPREAGLYSELAHVYMLLGDREAAERCLAMMRSLDGRASKEDTDKALDILESRYSDFKLYGKIRAGVQYDSNVNLGPESDSMDLGIWRVRVPGAKETGSAGAYLGASLDMGKRFYRDSPWWLVGDGHIFWRGHAKSSFSDTHNRESQWGRAAIGIRHLGSTTLAEIRLKGEILDYEFWQNVSSVGPEAALVWAATPGFHLIARGNYDERRYSRDKQRNGAATSAGIYGRFFFGADNHELLLGGRYLDVDAKRKAYRNDGWETSARMLLKLPHGFELTPFVSYGKESYQGPATILESKDREDKRWRGGIGLSYRINESLSVEAGYQYTNNKSASNLYKYKQHFVNTGLVWSF